MKQCSMFPCVCVCVYVEITTSISGISRKRRKKKQEHIYIWWQQCDQSIKQPFWPYTVRMKNLWNRMPNFTQRNDNKWRRNKKINSHRLEFTREFKKTVHFVHLLLITDMFVRHLVVVLRFIQYSWQFSSENFQNGENCLCKKTLVHAPRGKV